MRPILPTKTALLSISVIAFFILVLSGMIEIVHSQSEYFLLETVFRAAPIATPTPTPTIVDLSPQPLPTEVPETNLNDVADALFGGYDVDCDGVRSSEDNCPFTYNPNQSDKDHNGIGNACDGKNKGKVESHCDPDGDGIPSYKDNCPLVCNPRQEDRNKNGVGDACDPKIPGSLQGIHECPNSQNTGIKTKRIKPK